MIAALLTIPAAALVGAAALAGAWALAGAVLLIQAFLVYGWFKLAPVPSLRGSRLVAFGAGVLATAVMMIRDKSVSIGPLAGVLAAALIAAFVHELSRVHGREYLTASLAATTTGATLTVLTASLLAERTAPSGGSVIAAAMATVAAATLGVQLPGSMFVRVGAGTLLGIAAGTAVGSKVSALGLGYGFALGLVVGLVAAAAGYVMDAARSTRRLVLPIAATLPIAFASPATYVVGRLLLG